MDRLWTQLEPVLHEHAYATIDHDPNVLLEVDGGPVGLKATLIYARLLGFDDEIVTEMWIPRAEPVILMPIRDRIRVTNEPQLSPSLRKARYVLQSSYSLERVAAEFAPTGIKLDVDYMFSVAHLRYRRRD